MRPLPLDVVLGAGDESRTRDLCLGSTLDLWSDNGSTVDLPGAKITQGIVDPLEFVGLDATLDPPFAC